MPLRKLTSHSNSVHVRLTLLVRPALASTFDWRAVGLLVIVPEEVVTIQYDRSDRWDF